MASDGMGSYAGQVLARVAPHWVAPSDMGQDVLEILLHIGSDGTILDCSSASTPPAPQYLIDAACGAVNRAGRMPAPEYGIAGVIYLAFTRPNSAERTPSTPLGGHDYAANVMELVRKHWIAPAVQGIFTVRVRLGINADGTVTSSAIEQSSGSNAVDSSVMEAVETTGELIPPPDGIPQDIILSFTVQGSNTAFDNN